MGHPGHANQSEWIRSALDRYEAELTRYAQRLTGDAETARDVVQETFLRLCREESERVEGHLAEWLFTVCRNHAFDLRRKERRMTTIADTAFHDREAHEPSPAAVAEDRDAAGRILHLLEHLPENQQEVIRLKFQNGLSYREISGITGLSVTNVGFLLHTGLKTLRRKMTPAQA